MHFRTGLGLGLGLGLRFRLGLGLGLVLRCESASVPLFFIVLDLENSFRYE